MNLFYIWCECNQSHLFFKLYNLKWWRLEIESWQMLNEIGIMGSSNTTISFVCGLLLWGRETSAGHSVPDRDAPIWILKESVGRCHSYRSVRSENWTVVQSLPVLAIVWLFSWEFPRMRSQSDHQYSVIHWYLEEPGFQQDSYNCCLHRINQNHWLSDCHNVFI